MSSGVFSGSKRLALALLVCSAIARSAHASDEDLVTARNAIHDKLYPVAVAHAEAYLRQTQGTPAAGVEALQLLLQALSEQHQNDRALASLDAWREVAAAAPDAGTFAFWKTLALLETGKPREALAVSEATLQAGGISAENADALRRVTARARLALGDTPAALSAYAEVDKHSTNSATRAENLLEWASTLEGVGQVSAALGVIMRQVELNVTGPVTDEGHLAYGRLLVRQGRKEDAETMLRALGSNKSAAANCRAQAWMEVSQLELSAGRTHEAVAAARSADEIESRPEIRHQAAFQLADLLLASTNTLDEGVTRMKALVRAYPEGSFGATAQFRLAESLLRQSRDQQAVKEYRIFLETFNDHEHETAALAGLGSALFHTGRFAESANLFQKAHDSTTNGAMRADCLFHAGDALHAAKQFRQAAETYNRIYMDYPISDVAPRALFLKADSLERADDGDGAEAAFAQASKLGANTTLAIEALLRLGALQAARAQTDQAIDTFTQALKATTNEASRGEALLGRGHAHYRAYHFERAMQDFSAAAEAQPAMSDEAGYWRALCLYGLQRDEEARDAAIAYVAGRTNSPWLSEMTLWVAKLDFNSNRLEASGKRFLEYVTRWPEGPSADAALLWAGRAAFRRADYTQTVELMSRLQRQYPRSPRFAESRFVQGDALCELARFDEAVLVFDEIISRYTDSDWIVQAWSRKGDALFSMGADKAARYEEASKAYREVLARHDATSEQTLQAEFKIGRCLEKMKRPDDALDRYYSHVIVRYMEDRSHGIWYSEAAGAWFVSAWIHATELLQQKGQIDQAEGILNRVIQGRFPGHEEAQQRMDRLRKGQS